MQEYIRVSIAFDGRTAANGLIDFYDVQRALYGFNRTIALAAHLALNREIITQAPSLKGAEVLALTPEIGSWKFTAVVVSTLSTGIYTIGTARTDTPLGHLISSIYDYALSETLGIELDYNKSIRKLIEERDISTQSIPTKEQLNSLIDKTRNSVIDMHRPIEKGTASSAIVTTKKQGRIKQLGPTLNVETLAAANDSFEGDQIIEFRGRVSSYNMNTYTGRLYMESEHRTISFELAKEIRNNKNSKKLSESLDKNIDSFLDAGDNIIFRGLKYTNRSNLLVKILVVDIMRISK